MLLFDVNQPAPTFSEIIIFTVAVFITTVLIFNVVMKYVTPDLAQEKKHGTKRELDALKTKQISPDELALSEFINAAVYAPIAEELFFRLFLFKTVLVNRLKLNKHLANLIQAILFGLFHISNILFSTTPSANVYVQIISATLGGLISGYSYMYSNSILPSFLAHAINNTIAINQEVVEYEKILMNINN